MAQVNPVTLLLSIGFSLLNNYLQRRKRAAAERRLNILRSPDTGADISAPKAKFLYGLTSTTGTQVYFNFASEFPATGTYAGSVGSVPRGKLNERQLALVQYHLSEGEIDSVIDVTQDGEPLPPYAAIYQPGKPGTASTLATAVNALMPAGSNTERTAKSTFDTASHITLVLSRDRENPKFDAFPLLEFFVKGRKIKTVTSTNTLSSTAVYSNNAVYVLLDYLIHGCGYPVSRIDLKSFRTAAAIAGKVMQGASTILQNKQVAAELKSINDIDTADFTYGDWLSNYGITGTDSYAGYDSGGRAFKSTETYEVKRHEFNGVIDTSRPMTENIDAILSSMPDAILDFDLADGKLFISIVDGFATTPKQAVFTEADCVSALAVSDPESRNQLVGDYFSASDDFNPKSITFPLRGSDLSDHWLDEDNNELSSSSISLPGLISPQAVRSALANEMLQGRRKLYSWASRNGFEYVRPGDVVTVRDSHLGIDEDVRVTDAVVGDTAIRFAGIEFHDYDYQWWPESADLHETVVAAGGPRHPAGTYLAPTGMNIAKLAGAANVTWNIPEPGSRDSQDNLVKAESLRGNVKRKQDNWQTVEASVSPETTSITINPNLGTDYDLRMRARYFETAGPGGTAVKAGTTYLNADGEERTASADYTVPAGQTIYRFSDYLEGKLKHTVLATPTNFKVWGTHGAISSTWDAVEGATGYQASLGTDAQATNLGVFNLASNAINGTGVSNGTLYYIKVRAIDINDRSLDSAYTAIKSVTPTAGILHFPTNLSATARDRRVILAWEHTGPNASKFRVSWGTTSAADSSTVDTTLHSATISNLANGTAYWFKVKALASSSANNSAFSPAVTATPAAGKLPSPANLTATAKAKAVEVDWDTVVGAGSYALSYGTDSDADDSVVTVSAPPRTVSGLTNGTLYYFKVLAVDSVNTANNSPYTAVKSATPSASASKPGPPGVPVLTGKTTRSLSFRCAAPSTGGTPTGYVWKYGTGLSTINFPTTTTSTNSVTLTGLSKNTDYHVLAAASNAVGTSGFTGPATGVSGTTLGPGSETGGYGVAGDLPFDESKCADLVGAGTFLYAARTGSSISELWKIDPGWPDRTTGGYGKLGDFPSGLGTPSSMARIGTDLYVADAGDDDLWKIDPADPDRTSGGYGRIGSLPSGLKQPYAMAAVGSDLYLADDSGENLWKIDPADPDRTTGGYGNLGTLPLALNSPSAMAVSGSDLYIADGTDGSLWKIDPDDPDTTSLGYGFQGDFASDMDGQIAMGAFGGKLYVASRKKLWTADPADPGKTTT